MQHLERNGALVLNVAGQIHRGHAAAPDLAFDVVAPGEAVAQLRELIGHVSFEARGGRTEQGMPKPTLHPVDGQCNTGRELRSPAAPSRPARSHPASCRLADDQDEAARFGPHD